MLLPSLLKSGDQVYKKVIKQLYQKMLLLNLLITRTGQKEVRYGRDYYKGFGRVQGTDRMD